MIIEAIEKSANILLVEPRFPRKYVPLALAKISAYAKARGKTVSYTREIKRGLFDTFNPDLVCITSLFTYDSEIIYSAIRSARASYPKARIIVGGVFATLMEKLVVEQGAEVFAGYSKELDQVVPDYSFNYELEEPWGDFSYIFTSRGCPNHCGYCAVPRLEKDRWINPNWKNGVIPGKKCIMISDNNLSASSMEHIRDVCSFIRDKNLQVVFDNGFDCKHITDEFAQEMVGLRFIRSGLRLAFDRIEEDGQFQIAVDKLFSAGVKKGSVMAYALFNFLDLPQEANYRMVQCVKHGVRPYPQQYRPLNSLERKSVFISKNWTAGLTKAFRNFWIMAGYYTKTDFVTWVKGQEKFKLSAEDWAAWENTKSNY